jgi:hypothetical protein
MPAERQGVWMRTDTPPSEGVLTLRKDDPTQRLR